MIYAATTASEERSQHSPVKVPIVCDGARIMPVCCSRNGATEPGGTLTRSLSPFLAPAGELICGGDINHGLPVFLSVRLWC